MKYIYTLISLIFLQVSLFASSGSIFQFDSNDSFVLKRSGLEYYHNQSDDAQITESIILDSKEYKLTLGKSDFDISNTIFKTNHKSEFQFEEAFFLEGYIEDISNSIISITIFDDNVFGFLELEDNVYVINKIEKDKYKFIKVDETQNPLKEFCNTDNLEENLIFEEEILDLYNSSDFDKDKNNDDTKLSYKRTVNVALDCDHEFYNLLGNDSIYVVQYALGLWASVNTIYNRDANVHIAVPYINVWTIQDPFTASTANSLLTQFKEYWKTNSPYNNRSVASLLSGHVGQGGLAWVGKLCNEFWGYSFMSLYGSYSYPSMDYYWDLHVTTHELGHNIGLIHTHNCSWNPPIDSCFTPENGDCFVQTVPTEGTIMSYCHLKSGASINLHFHDRCIPIIQAAINQALCTPNTEPPTLDIPEEYITCNNSLLEIGGEAIGGTPPYTYEWVQGTFIHTFDTCYTIVNPQQTNQYILRVRDANNLEAFDSTIVNVLDAPTAQINGPISVCENSYNDFHTIFNQNYSYKWYMDGAEMIDPDTSNYVRVRWSETGIKQIKVVVRQRNGICVDSSEIKVEVLEMGIEPIQGNDTVCQYSKLVYTTNPNSDLMYFWKAFGAKIKILNNDNCTIQFDTLGTSTLRLFAENAVTGCIDSTEFEVVVRPQPIAFIEVQDTVCENSEVIVTTPMPEYEVHNTWSVTNGDVILENDSTFIFTTESAGIITIGLKSENSDNSCSDSTNKTIEVFKPEAPEIYGVPQEVCVNEELILSTAPLDDYNYEWSATAAEIISQEGENCILKFLESGSQTVMMIIEHKSSGCKDTSYATIEVLQGPSVPAVEGLYTVCRTSTNQYKTVLNNKVIYKWYATGGTIVGKDNGFYVDIKWNDDNPTLLLEIESPTTGCKSNISFPISYHNEPNYRIDGSFYVCDFTKEYKYSIDKNTNFDLDVNITGGSIISQTNDSFIIKWDENANDLSIDLEFLDNEYGCVYNYSYPLSSNIEDVYYIEGNDSICYLQEAYFTLNNLNGIASIDWYFNDDYVGDNLNLEITTASEGILRAELIFNNACSATLQKDIYIDNNSGSIDIIGPVNSCIECIEEYQLITSPKHFDYKLYVEGGDILKQNGDYIQVKWGDTDAGVIHAKASFDSNPCTAENTLDVTINAIPDLEFEVSYENCKNDTIMLSTGQLNYNVEWQSNDIYIDKPNNHKTFAICNALGAIDITLIKYLEDDSYKDSISIPIFVADKPAVPSILIENTNIARSSDCHTEDNQICDIQWYFEDKPIENATDLTLKLTKTGSYKVEHISEYMCSTFSEPYYYQNTAIEAENNTKNLFVFPNPSSGFISIVSPELIDNIVIYNSLGDKVFEANNKNIAYKHSLDLHYLSSGIYYIRINQSKFRESFILQK